MKKPLRLTIACLFLASLAQLYAQNCTFTDLRLNSQSAVNAFDASCTHIKGDITISGTDITDLSPLKNVENIDGKLVIQGNASLASLSGLEKLTTVKNLFILSNGSLTDLTGLDGLTSISGTSQIQFLNALTSLKGLDKLATANSLTISSNPLLKSLSGLGALTTITDILSITSNAGLLSLEGLGSLSSAKRINVGGNDLLTSLAGLEALQSVSYQMQINFNKGLTSLAGLTNLQHLSEAYITSNDALVSLSGLEVVTGVKWLVVADNKKLNALTGLNNLATAENMIIRNNGVLADLSGLENLISVGWLQITRNPELLSISALGAASGGSETSGRVAALTISGLDITSNPKLTNCAIEPVCSFIATGTANISGNSTGCENQSVISTICGALPVTLVDFTAAAEQKTIRLSWSTADETGSAAFEIEHSLQGKGWEVVGSQKAKGESTERTTYQWVHHQPAAGTNYYRLKMVDLDGSFTHSRIERAILEGNVSAGFVYPNPSTEQLRVDKPEQVTNLTVTNMNGQIVYDTKQMPADGIPVQKFAAGVYLVRIKRAGGAFQTKRIVIR